MPCGVLARVGVGAAFLLVASLPVRAQAAASSSAVLTNQPVHAPAKVEFGDVWNGQASRRTFTFKTNGNGLVAVALPAGPFRIAEYREMGLGGHGSADSSAAWRNIKNRVVYPPNTFGPLQWNLVTGTEIQIDLVFEPKFQLGSMMAGPKTAAFSVKGPGPRGPWALAVPLAGLFNGMRVQPLLRPTEPELLATYYPGGSVPLDLFDPVKRSNARPVAGRAVITGTVTALDPILGTVTIPGLDPFKLIADQGTTVKLRAGQSQSFQITVAPTADPGMPGAKPPSTLQLVLSFKRVADPSLAQVPHPLPNGWAEGTVSAPVRITVLREPMHWRIGPLTIERLPGNAEVLVNHDGRVQMSWLGGDLGPRKFTLFLPGLGRAVLSERDRVSSASAGNWFFRGQIQPKEYAKAVAAPPRIICTP